MYHKIVWCYVFVLTLLDISPNSKLSAQGKSHGVSVHDSLAEGVTFQEWGGSSSSSGEGGGAAGGGGAGGGRARAAAEGVSLQPPALHFGHAPLAAPHARSITLTNVANATLHLASVAGTTPDFHASFFESKTLAPQANTTFSVVYLGRREGPVSAHLYIHTSLGVFKYPVSAVGVANPWGVWPLVDVRVPLNATVEPLLTMHNPTEHTIQVSEVYSSGAWLGLALPEGGEWAPRDRWTLPPHSSRAIVRLRLQPPHHHHHHHSLTAYVRIKGNMTGGGLVVGVEARAAPAGEYLAPVQLGLRVRGSRDPPDTFQLEAGNSMAAPLSVEAGVWGARCGAAERWSPPPPPPEPAPHEPAPHHHNGHADAPAHNGEKSEGVYLTLIRSQLEPHQRLTKAAELTLDYAQMWSSYSESQSAEQDAADGAGVAGAAGEAWCAGWARVGRAALRYAVRLLPGTLRAEPPALHVVTARGEEAQAAREVRLHNEFPVPVRLMAAHCPAEVLEHFHCETPVPMTLAPGAAAAVLLLRPRAPLAPHLALHAPLTFHTNLTSCTVPLLVYSGRLALEWEWPNSSEGALRLGTVGTSSTRRVGVRVLNPGPARLCVAELRVELPGAQLALAACAHLRPVPPDHACRCVEGYGAARGVLTVVAPARAGRVRGWLELRSEHAGLRAELELHAHAGRLRAHALHLPAAAPYAWSSAPLVLESSMAALRMQVVNVTQPTPDPAVKFVPTPDVDVTTGRHTVGEVLFMPEKLCEPNCYTGLDIATAEGARWAARGGGGLRTDAALARARRALYATLAPRNVSLHVHTTHVVQIPVAGSAQWRWPRVLDAAGAGGAALAAVGAAAALQVRARNPSPAHRLLLQPVLADAHYDVTGTTESSFCKTENCVWSRDAFKLTEWKAIRGEARVWDASADGTAGVEATHNVSDYVMPMLVLEPETELEIKITFSPKEPSALSTYFYLRNNLTILEGVQLLGRGAYPSFEIGGRRPGTNAPLLFEVKDCGSTGATVVRTVLARNTGVVPVWLRDWRLAGQPCHARGFRLQPCAPLALAPNESRHLHLAFTADYTLARVPCRLSLRADSAPADFSLVAVAPAALLPRCHAAASRPPFEPAMRAGGTLLALTVLALVLVAAVLDAERELNRARPPRPPVAAAARAPLDLRALADEPAPPPPPAPRARPPPPRRRRTPRRPPPPPDPQAERRAFERWRTEMLRVADDDDSRSSEDADAEVARNDSHDERPPPREPPPEPVEIDAGVANDGYEADPETEERTPGSGDEDADSTGSTSASASSTPADEHDGEDNDDRARTPVDVEPPPDSSPKTDVGRPTDSQPRAGRTRREPGDAPRRAERTRAEPDAAARARAPPGKQHARRDKCAKRRAERGAGSPPRGSPARAPEPRGGGVRWGASWSSVVAAGAPGPAPAPPALAPIGSDVRRRAEPEPRAPPAADNSLFFFNGESHPPRPDPEYAWRPSPPADRPPFDSAPRDFLGGCEETVGAVGAVGAGAFRPLGSVWGSLEPAAWPWGSPRHAPLRPPPGFPPAPPPPARVYDPFCSLAAIWGPAGLDWRPPHAAAPAPAAPAPPAPTLHDDDLDLDLAHAHAGNN